MRDPLDDWIREDAAALAGYYSIHQAGVACTSFGRQFLQVLQAPLAAQVAGNLDKIITALENEEPDDKGAAAGAH